jgi:hypothetical protein
VIFCGIDGKLELEKGREGKREDEDSQSQPTPIHSTSTSTPIPMQKLSILQLIFD